MAQRDSDGLADLILSAVVVIGIGVVLSFTNDSPPLPKVAPSSQGFIAFQLGPAPEQVVTLSADQRTLTVTEHARRDLLICIRGRCDIAEVWTGGTKFIPLGPMREATPLPESGK